MPDTPAGQKLTTVVEASKQLGADKHCLLDVRTEEEFREISVPGALNIPLDRLQSNMDKLAPYSSIHVICRSGGRSAAATDMLQQLGVTNVANVSGGMLAWQAAGLPTT